MQELYQVVFLAFEKKYLDLFIIIILFQGCKGKKRGRNFDICREQESKLQSCSHVCLISIVYANKLDNDIFSQCNKNKQMNIIKKSLKIILEKNINENKVYINWEDIQTKIHLEEKTPNELKKEINKTLSEASTVAASKEKWKDLVRGLCSTQR